MDAAIFIIISLVFVLMQVSKEDTNSEVLEHIEKEDMTRTAKLNDSFYEDPDAFMDIAHALGFNVGND